jgi:hypothetical protein
LRQHLTESTVRALWTQWRAVGGSASTAHRATSIVDPEALILASLYFRDDEPRLRDLLDAWVERNSALLSVRRLRALAPAYAPVVGERLREFAPLAEQLTKHPRWAVLADADSPRTRSKLHRPEVARAVAPDLTMSPALMLRLRTAFGVGVKADALTYLLGQSERGLRVGASVRAIAEATRYTLVATRRAVEDLAASRLVLTYDERPVTFFVAAEPWEHLLDLRLLPSWHSWHSIFAFATTFVAWADRSAQRAPSEAVFSVRLREMLSAYPAVRHLILNASDSKRVDSRTAAGNGGAVTAVANWMDHAA